MAERRRIATKNGSVLRGVGVTDDRNGPFTLCMKPDGIDTVVVLNTREWDVRWEDEDERDRILEDWLMDKRNGPAPTPADGFRAGWEAAHRERA